MVDERFWRIIALCWVKNRPQYTGKEIELKKHKKRSTHDDMEGADDELP